MLQNETIRVLICEDDYLVSEEIIRLVEQLGHEVVADVAAGHEAVKMVKQLQPDIVIMDIEMPVMNGIEAAGEIRKECPTPVIILTAQQSEELVEEASKAGVGAYITKPPSAKDLAHAIIIAIARHKDLLELSRVNEELAKKNEEVLKQMEEIVTLRGVIPVCASCHNIMDDQGTWDRMEEYISKHSLAEFSHTVCPECTKKLYPEFYKKKYGNQGSTDSE